MLVTSAPAMMAGGIGNLLLTPIRGAACRAPHHRAAAQRARRPDRGGLPGAAAGRPAGRQGAAVDHGRGLRDPGPHRQARRRRTAARNRRAEPVASDGDGAAAPSHASRARTGGPSMAAADRRRRRRLQGRLDRRVLATGRRPVGCGVSQASPALVDALPDDAVIAVDMPIGLPDFTRHGGRGPEALVRPLLGAAPVERLFHSLARGRLCRRRAVHHGRAWYAAHRRASDVATRDIRSAARRLDPGIRHLLRRSARSTRC